MATTDSSEDGPAAVPLLPVQGDGLAEDEVDVDVEFDVDIDFMDSTPQEPPGASR